MLVCRPFNWMVELLGRLASSCRERFQRRTSASTASTQQDPEVSLYKMPPSFVLQNSEWAPVLTYGGTYVARTYTRKHRFGVHARALLQPCCFLVVCIRQYPGVGHSLSILRQLGGPALPNGDKLLLVQMAAPYLKVGSSSYCNTQILFSP
jgi:hypothetical protein